MISSLSQATCINIRVILMILSILASSVAVIYIKHHGRAEFTELQKLELNRNQLNDEWGRLLLEYSTWMDLVRVERQTRNHLKMIVPTAEMIVVIRP